MNCCNSWPVAASHRRAVLSSLPVSTCWPSGENATLTTRGWGRGTAAIRWPVATSHSRAVPSKLAGEDGLAVGRKDAIAHRLGRAGKRAQGLPRRGIPQARRGVIAAGEHPFAVRGESDRLYRAGVADELLLRVGQGRRLAQHRVPLGRVLRVQGADRQEGHRQVITPLCLQQDIGFGGQALGLGVGPLATAVARGAAPASAPFATAVARWASPPRRWLAPGGPLGSKANRDRPRATSRNTPAAADQHAQPVGRPLLQRQLRAPGAPARPAALVLLLAQAGRQVGLLLRRQRQAPPAARPPRPAPRTGPAAPRSPGSSRPAPPPAIRPPPASTAAAVCSRSRLASSHSRSRAQPRSSASCATSTVGSPAQRVAVERQHAVAAEEFQHPRRRAASSRAAEASSARRTRRRVSSAPSPSVTRRRKSWRASACSGVGQPGVQALGARRPARRTRRRWPGRPPASAGALRAARTVRSGRIASSGSVPGCSATSCMIAGDQAALQLQPTRARRAR